jgi:hypothetical protein
VLKELVVPEGEKQKKEKEAALTDAWKALSSMNGKVSWAEEDAHVAREAAEKAKEKPPNQGSKLPQLRRRLLRLGRKPCGIKMRPLS